MKMKKVLSLLTAIVMTSSVLGQLTLKAEAAMLSESSFFDKLNYSEFPALSAVKAASDSGDYALAKTELLNYYRSRSISGEVKGFDITERDANIGMSNLAKDYIIPGAYEFDVWMDTVRVDKGAKKEYTAAGAEITSHVIKEVENKNISVLLFERQKQNYPIYIASRESSTAPCLVVTLADDTKIEIEPNKDTYTDSGNPDTVFGSAEVLETNEQSDDISNALGNQTRRAYVNFPLDALAQKEIKSAVLKFTAWLPDDCTSDSLEFHIISVGDATWSEQSYNWSTMMGSVYSWQNSESGPWWNTPAGCGGDYSGVTLRYWYARPMAWEYLKYAANPQGYPEGKEYGEKLLSLMNAITQKYDQVTQKAGRTIEFGERNNRWVDVLYNFLKTPLMNPEENPNAAEYFYNIVNYMWGDMNFTRTNTNLGWSNWGAAYLAGMQKAYDFFPEFTASADWRSYNVSRLTQKFRELYNDDMSFVESGPAYAIWCAELFGDAYRMAQLNGKPFDGEYKTMLNYATRFAMECAYPNGYDSNIGDSNFRPQMRKFEDIAAALNDSHITNFITGGKEGEADYYTRYYKNINSAYMRNSWNPDEAVYINFTNNPSDGHAHPDSNQVLFYAYGQPLLVDSGRYGYDTRPAIYSALRSAYSHNTIEAVGVSMAGHSTAAGKLDHALTNSVFDFASSTQKGYSGTQHERNVLFLKEGFALVSDYVTGSASRTYRQNWHFLPSSNASVNQNVVTSNFYNKANVTIAAASAEDTQIRSGFHSADYGMAVVNEYASYEKVGAEVKFDTLLYPTKAGETASVIAEDLAPNDISKGAVHLRGDVEADYYVKNTQNSDGKFGVYTTDAKVAFVSDDTLLMADGAFVTGGAIAIESPMHVDDIALEIKDGSLFVTGNNLKADTNQESAIAITAQGVDKVFLNGSEVAFNSESGVIYAVKVAASTTVETVGTLVADKDGYAASSYGNEGAKVREVIQAQASWQNRNSYIAFDFSEYANKPFSKAVLKMNVTEAANGGTLHFYWLDYGTWTRDDLTFVLDSTKMPSHTANSGTYSGYPYHFTANVAGVAKGEVFEADFTKQLKEYLAAGGAPKFTLAMLSAGGSTKFASLDNTEYAAPSIVLTNETLVGDVEETKAVVSFVTAEGVALQAPLEISDVTPSTMYVYSDAPQFIEYEGVKYALDGTNSALGTMIIEGETANLTALYVPAAKVSVHYICNGTIVESTEEFVVPGSVFKVTPITTYRLEDDIYLVDTQRSHFSITAQADSENTIEIYMDKLDTTGGNLITNGDFKNSAADWTNAANGNTYSGVVSANYAHGDSMSLTNSAKGNGNAESTLRRFVPVESGKKYYMSFYVYNASGAAITSNARMSAFVPVKGKAFGTFDGVTFKDYVEYGGQNSWSVDAQTEVYRAREDMKYDSGMNHKEYVFNIPSDAQYLLLSMFAWTNASELYFSDFELYEINEELELTFDGTAATIKNRGETQTNLIVAQYDADGCLIKCDSVKTSDSLNSVKADDAVSAKAFCWDANMKPLSEAVEVMYTK